MTVHGRVSKMDTIQMQANSKSTHRQEGLGIRRESKLLCQQA